jgi:hypothetical protein
MVHAQEIAMDEERGGYGVLFYIMIGLGIFGLIGMLAVSMSAGGGL